MEKNKINLKNISYRQNILSSIWNKLLGDVNQFSMENRIFNAAILVAGCLALISILWNLAMDLPVMVSIIISCSLIVVLVMYYYARFKRIYNSFLYVMVCLAILSLCWFTSEGSQGSVPILYIIAVASFMTIAKPGYHIPYLLIALLNIAILYLLETLFYDELIIVYPSEKQRQLDLLMSLGTSITMSYIFVTHFKKTYENEHAIITKQKQELQELNTTKDKLYSLISHDLRSPFTSILGLSQVLSDKAQGLSTEKIKEFANLMNDSAQSVYRLLENLLDWAKIQQGKVSINPENILLKPFIIQNIELVKGSLVKKNIDIVIDIPEKTMLSTDRNVLQIIIRNLLSNAIKFTPKGGNVHLSSVSKFQSIEITIKDTGIGMPPSMVDNLFKLDAMSGRKGTEGESSSGLGLILCKEFIEKLGGNIRIKSEVGKGSDFTVLLPDSNLKKEKAQIHPLKPQITKTANIIY